MGILRTTLIVGALAVALPSPPQTAGSDTVPATGGTYAYIAAAAETFADVKAFCLRNPNVCRTAGHIANRMEAKAKYSAKLIYEWANEATYPGSSQGAVPSKLAQADPIVTGATAGQKKTRLPQSTLKLEDLIPEWHAPKAHNKG